MKRSTRFLVAAPFFVSALFALGTATRGHAAAGLPGETTSGRGAPDPGEGSSSGSPEEPTALHVLASQLVANVRAAHAQGPLALWVSAQAHPAVLSRAFATLLAAKLGAPSPSADGAPPLPTVVLDAEDAPDAASAEHAARAAGAASLVRLELTLEPSRVWAQGDLLGTWVNFWSGRVSTRPPQPAAVLRVSAPLDAHTRALAGLPGPVPTRGGTLRVLAVGLPPESHASGLGAHPLEAVVRGWVQAPLCRLGPDRTVQGVLAEGLSVTSTLPSSLELQLRPTASDTLSFAALQASLAKLRASQSPYRALVHSLSQEALRPTSLPRPLPLAYPWPDLPGALCHPLALGELPANTRWGPFHPPEHERFRAHPGLLPERPFVDTVWLQRTEASPARRLFSLGRVDLLLGAGDGPPEARPEDGPALWTTYLVYRPSKVGESFGAQVESVIDRAELVRFFARPPAVPVTGLFPPALGPTDEGLPGSDAVPPPSHRPPTAAPRPSNPTLKLLFDESRDDHRAVAERLEVKLLALGHKVALLPVKSSALDTTWRQQEEALMLYSVLLPPLPAPALGVLLELAGRSDLLSVELPPLGAVSAASQRDAHARERARALAARLPLVPLFAQPLRLRSHPNVQGLTRDGFGLPVVEDVFLPSPSPAP